MIYQIEPTSRFLKLVKRLCRKYPSLLDDVDQLTHELKIHPITGTAIGMGCYKIRLAIKSKGKGKSGGGRVITYVYVAKTTVYLLTIYDKSEREDISDKELKELLKGIE